MMKLSLRMTHSDNNCTLRLTECCVERTLGVNLSFERWVLARERIGEYCKAISKRFKIQEYFRGGEKTRNHKKRAGQSRNK